MRLTDLLVSPPESFVKDADIENPDQTQLENDFGNMAFLFLRDRAAALMPYLLGFEVVEREEDGSKAVGIFGFKISNQYYYVPVFFVNNQVKGMDMLFSKETNSFVPLRETWINNILNKSTFQLGQNEPNEDVRQDFWTPNFMMLTRPPLGGKMASAEPIGAVIKSGFDVWNYLQGAVEEGMQKDADFQAAWAGAVCALKKQPFEFTKTADGSPLVSFLQKFGGPRAVNSMLATIQTSPAYANAMLTFYPDFKSVAINEFDASMMPIKTAAKLSVTSSPREGMGSKDQSRIVSDGFTILDSRDPDEQSEVFDLDYVRRYSNPERGGAYDMLLPSGSAVRAWILVACGGAANGGMVVVEPDNKFFFTADPSRVWVRGGRIDDEGPYAKAKSLDSMESGKTYIILNERFEGTGPFTIRSVVAENGKRVLLKGHFCHHKDYQKEKHDTWETNGPSNPIGYGPDECDSIQLADYTSPKLHQVGTKMIVPSNWKALLVLPESEYADQEVPYKEDGKTDYDKRDAARETYKAFQPGSLTDLEEAMLKHALHKLTVEGDPMGSDYYIYLDEAVVGPMSKKQAYVKLVHGFGLNVDDAESIMKDAMVNTKSRHMVKFAQGVGVSFNPMAGPTYYSDPDTGAIINEPYMEEARGQFLGAPVLRDPLVPGFAVGGQSEHEASRSGPSAQGGAPALSGSPAQPIPGEAIQLAQQAAQSGQKTVFDHSTIGSLSKLYDASAAIDMYMPELMKALDRLGRILFIFYWKNEDFADRYGKDAMAEMEDLLRAVFKSFGDMVLKLKQKSVNPEDSKDILAT